MLWSINLSGILVRSFIEGMWSYERGPSGISARVTQTGGYHGNGCSSPFFRPCASERRARTLQNTNHMTGNGQYEWCVTSGEWLQNSGYFAQPIDCVKDTIIILTWLNKTIIILPCLTLSYYRTRTRTKSQNRCDSCTYIQVYVHGLCDRNMGLLPASNRHFTVSPHEVFTCFRSAWHPLHQMFTNRKKSGVYSKLSAVFGEFRKITIVGPSSIHRLAWNTTAKYMDFLPWKWS